MTNSFFLIANVAFDQAAAPNAALEHERAGELSAPFETDVDRQTFRAEIARVLDDRQPNRLASGNTDALDKVLEDRLDRFYVAKVYLQSDSATANTEALRRSSMIWPTPNTNGTAQRTWTARPSGARSIERHDGQGTDRIKKSY